ncbi:MAG: 3,4-dihydroxy-2-butanone-4-phosphate synthase, partial [Victivallaceae bacterium]|nr:3,4-dihydroxy-2-butanone-4-phosphate synthase [Victivallaceae bacterium]
MTDNVFVTSEEAMSIIRDGGILILTDDEKRENEGDFVMAAEYATPETVNFMITHGRGLLCISASADKIEKMGLPMMVEKNTSKLGTPFTVPIDAKEGTTTGISAHERCETIKTFVKPDSAACDFNIPGHLFPLKAVKGGILHRAGHTEGTTDVARLAGCKPIGLLCEILNEDGTMARMP